MTQAQRIPASRLSSDSLCAEAYAPTRTEKTWAAAALRIQSESCLSRVAADFAAMQVAMTAAGFDGAEAQDHPASRLYAAKLADLCGLNYHWPSDASVACHRLVAAPGASEEAA